MAVPVVAREVFGDALPAAERYAALLAGAGVERGLIGPRESTLVPARACPALCSVSSGPICRSFCSSRCSAA